jgi:excisionase family DNA binding protein
MTGRPTADSLILSLPAELVEQIAERAAELVLERIEATPPSRWMTVEETAEYMRCTRQHVYDLRSDGRLGRYGEHGHALVDRREVDAYLDKSGGRYPRRRPDGDAYLDNEGG